MARYGRKRQLGLTGKPSSTPSGRIEVLSRRSVGRHVSLLVVRVADQTLLVGQSGQQVTLLAELTGDEWQRTDPAGTRRGSGDAQLLAPRTALGVGGDSPGAWDACMDRLREMTVRR
jgi:flagellar biogenesis protein FliO